MNPGKPPENPPFSISVEPHEERGDCLYIHGLPEDLEPVEAFQLANGYYFIFVQPADALQHRMGDSHNPYGHKVFYGRYNGINQELPLALVYQMPLSAEIFTIVKIQSGQEIHVLTFSSNMARGPTMIWNEGKANEKREEGISRYRLVKK